MLNKIQKESDQIHILSIILFKGCDLKPLIYNGFRKFLILV